MHPKTSLFKPVFWWLLSLFVLLLAGCSDKPATKACFKPMMAGVHPITLIQGGVDRSFEVYVPSSYLGLSTPLAFLLHGSGQAGPAILKMTNPKGRQIFTDNADENAYLLAAPSGVITHGAGFAWNVLGVPLPSSTDTKVNPQMMLNT